MKTFRTTIYINAFITGALIMALEMTGSRFLTPFFGNSVYTWASIISIVLLSLAVGYFLGGFLAEKKPDTTVISFVILLAAICILFIPLYYESLFKRLYDFFEDPKIGGFFGAFLTLFFPMLLLGVYSPFSVKLISKFSENTGKIAGTLYAVSTIGSIFGTIGVTFFLIPVIGSKSIFYTVSFFSFLSALSLFVLKPNIVSKLKTFLLFAFIVFVLMFALIVFNDSVKKAFEIQPKSSKYLIEEVESEYNTITVKKKGDYISMSFRRHQSGHIESSINIKNEYELPLGYTQLMQAGFLYQTNPKNLLMVGLGGGTISRYIKQYYKEVKITGVELDKDVINLSKKYFKLKEDSFLNVVNEDGRIFLSDSEDYYDIIMLDAYKGGYIPFHLCTHEFYELVKSRLTDSGVVVLNLHSGSKLFNSLLFTLNKSFRYLDLYNLKSKGNVVVIGYNFNAFSDRTLEKRADSLQRVYQFYHSLPNIFKTKTHVKIDSKTLLTDDFAPVNFLNAVSDYNKK